MLTIFMLYLSFFCCPNQYEDLVCAVIDVKILIICSRQNLFKVLIPLAHYSVDAGFAEVFSLVFASARSGSCQAEGPSGNDFLALKLKLEIQVARNAGPYAVPRRYAAASSAHR